MAVAMVDSAGRSMGGNGRTGPSAVPAESFWTKSLARSLTLPIFVLDGEGNLAYYNPAAAHLLGRSHAEVGPLPPEEWAALWSPTNIEGSPIPLERLPVMVALLERRPMHGWLDIMGLDGVRRHIEVTALPLDGPDGGSLGAVAVFWEQARD